MHKILNSRRFALIASILLAILYWVVLSFSDDASATQTIYNVPVQLDYNASSYQNFGLDMVGDPQVSVDVTVEGPLNIIGSLKPDDFLIYPIVNSVTSPGLKTLNLAYYTLNTNAKYKIVDLSSYMISIRFDTMVSEKFTVVPELADIKVADGYVMNGSVAAPTEVTISGPQTEISQISTVKAVLPDITEELTESKLTTGTLKLLDKDGNEVSSQYLTMDAEQVEVNISILKKATVNLSVEFVNVPQGFDITTLKYSIDHTRIAAAVPVNSTESEQTIVAGYVDLQSLDYTKDYTFDIQLPENYVNLDNVSTVTFSCDKEYYATKLVTVSDIRLVNVPSGKKVDIETSKIYNVLLVGPRDVLDNINADSVIAQVDASKLTVQKGQEMLAANILVPSDASVFATGGSYKVVIGVE